MTRKTTPYARKHARAPRPQFTLARELLASPTEPTPAHKRTHQLTAMWQGLAALETAPNPLPHDWRVVSDAVNLLEMLVEMGEVQDTEGLLKDAVTAMGAAGARAQRGQVLRLDGKGIQAVRAVLEDYAQALAVLPERTLTQAHRRTEQRIHAIRRGRRDAGTRVVEI